MGKEKNWINIGFWVCFIIFSCVCVEVGGSYASGISMVVTPDVASDSLIDSGGQLAFTVLISNSSEAAVVVNLSNNYDNRTQSVMVVEQSTVEVRIQLDIAENTEGGSALDIKIDGSLNDGSFIGHRTFTYRIRDTAVLSFSVNARLSADVVPGTVLLYDVVIVNNGNTEAKNIRLESSVDPEGGVVVSSVMPGASRSEVLSVTVPESEGTVFNVITLTASGVETQQRTIPFTVLPPPKASVHRSENHESQENFEIQAYEQTVPPVYSEESAISSDTVEPEGVLLPSTGDYSNLPAAIGIVLFLLVLMGFSIFPLYREVRECKKDSDD